MLPDDFKKDWKVLFPGSDLCKTGEIVKIFEPEEGVVRIQCGDRFPYADASYDPAKKRIQGTGYFIQLQIAFIPDTGGNDSGGSWTAEDNPSGPAE